jgi:hypothetical protein
VKSTPNTSRFESAWADAFPSFPSDNNKHVHSDGSKCPCRVSRCAD